MTFVMLREGARIHDFNSLAYIGTDPLNRDRSQSDRLHEPGLMISTIDPITGRDIDNLEAHPYIIDGDMVMYFESEETRQAYIDTPIDHPVRLPDNPTGEGWAVG